MSQLYAAKVCQLFCNTRYNQIGQDIGGSVDVINFYDIKFLSALILIPYL